MGALVVLAGVAGIALAARCLARRRARIYRRDFHAVAEAEQFRAALGRAIADGRIAR